MPEYFGSPRPLPGSVTLHPGYELLSPRWRCFLAKIGVYENRGKMSEGAYGFFDLRS